MTTGTNPEPGPAARRWAAEVLGVEQDATSAEARRAYLRQLRDSDFLPLPSLRQALWILEGKPAPPELGVEWRLEEEGRLRGDVEAFAAEFFSLAVPQRRQRWQELLSRCESTSPLAARLNALKAGLAIQVEGLPLDSSFHGQLAEQLLHSFPLPPLAQATSRQAFLSRVEDPMAFASYPSWEKAGRYLLAEWPALAALDQELVGQVAKLSARLQRRREMRQRSQERQQAAAGSGEGFPWWVVWVVVCLGGGILRGALRNSDSSPAPRVPPPSFTDRKTGTSPLQPVTDGLPSIDELIDPARYDVDLVPPGRARVLCFTPRRNATIPGSNRPPADPGKPLFFGEAALTLMGVSREQVAVLIARAEERQKAKKQPSQGDKTRP